MISTGIHHSVPPHKYHRRRIGVVSKSALDMVHRSPAHYKAWVDGLLPERDTPALRFGVAFHCALLEPERFEREYTVEPDFGDCRKKENRAARDEWRAVNDGKTPLSEEDYEAIRGMVTAVHSHELAGKMIRDGEPELTVSWTDDETGLQCKARADYYVRKLGMVLDIKSTEDATWEGFRRNIAKWRYHVQDALYRAGFAAVGEPCQHFVFVAVEKTFPHAIGIYTLDADSVSKGYSAARRDITTLAECLKKDEWPGYPTGIQTIELPPWAE